MISRLHIEKEISKAVAGLTEKPDEVAKLAAAVFWRELNEDGWVVVRKQGKNEYGAYYLRPDLKEMEDGDKGTAVARKPRVSRNVKK